MCLKEQKLLWEKKENDASQHCLLFPQGFQKASSSRSFTLSPITTTVKPGLDTTCIKRPLALRGHCSVTVTLLKSL